MKAPATLYVCPGCWRIGVSPDFRRHLNCEGTPVKYLKAKPERHLRVAA